MEYTKSDIDKLTPVMLNWDHIWYPSSISGKLYGKRCVDALT